MAEKVTFMLGVKYILVGAGASGKDHTKNILLENGFSCDVSVTTRNKRPNEVDGKDYTYVTMEEFEKMIENNMFLQYEKFGNGHFYGTSIESWEKNDIFIMSPPALEKLSKSEHRDTLNNAIIVYFNIPENIRRRRLTERVSDDDVERRLQTDSKDFAGFKDFDVVVTSEDFEVVIS